MDISTKGAPKLSAEEKIAHATKCYKAVNGWDMSVPQILVAAIVKRGGLDKMAGIKPKRRAADDDE